MMMSEIDPLAEGELQLKDFDFIEEKKREQPAESLPAALCDDLLLQEIKSIPDKMGFKIGDVAELLQIKPYVLRYWETEFDVLKPRKASNNQRLYTRRDVENAYLVRKLLHRDRFSIEGARNAMKELKSFVKKEKDYTVVLQKFQNLSVTYSDRLESLAQDVRKLRTLFK
ncbi:MAG: MerR family transcriptional regulator [Bdellovibrionales bacterium]